MVVPRPLLQPLVPRLRRLLPGLAMSSATGSFSLQQPLNYRGGARLQPADGGQVEEVYEPATGGGHAWGHGSASGGLPRPPYPQPLQPGTGCDRLPECRGLAQRISKLIGFSSPGFW